jgi:hypothetical protein
VNRRPALSLVLVAGLLAAGVGAAEATRPGPPPVEAGPAERRAPVTAASAVCPDPMPPGEGVTSSVTLVSPPPDAVEMPLAPDGRAVMTPLGSPQSELARLDSTGLMAVAPVPPEPAPLAAQATGALAPGLTLSQYARVVSGDLRGLATLACPTPTAESWFVGSGATLGRRGRVYLANPTAAAAVVDVELFGPDGPIDAPAGRSVPVPSGGQRVLLLDGLAPDVPVFAVHVAARQGRIAAAVRDEEKTGLDPLGTDWVPPASAPATEVTVPAIPGMVGARDQRRLQIFVPGESDAVVAVQVLTAQGPYTPEGVDVISAAGGAVTEVDLGSLPAEGTYALCLESDVPVTAGVLVRRGADTGLLELAATSAVQASRDVLVTPALPAAGGIASTLALGAPEGETRVELLPVVPAAGTPPDPVTLEVGAGTTRVVDLAALTVAGGTAVVVRRLEGSGPVAAGVVLEEETDSGRFVTISPLVAPRVEVTVPPVTAELSAGLR